MRTESHCIRCGYLLLGLEGIAHCPECGLEVDASLVGRELRHAHPVWVSRLADGASLYFLGVVGFVAVALLQLARIVLPSLWSGTTTLNGISFGLMWAGAMLVASDPLEPERIDQTIKVRRWLQIAATAQLLAEVFVAGAYRSFDSVLIYWARSVTTVAAFALFYIYLRQLARRIPDAFIIRHSPFVMSALIASQFMLLWVPALLAYVFPATAMRTSYNMAAGTALYYVSELYAVALMWRARKQFAAAAITSRENWVRIKSVAAA